MRAMPMAMVMAQFWGGVRGSLPLLLRLPPPPPPQNCTALFRVCTSEFVVCSKSFAVTKGVITDAVDAVDEKTASAARAEIVNGVKVLHDLLSSPSPVTTSTTTMTTSQQKESSPDDNTATDNTNTAESDQQAKEESHHHHHTSTANADHNDVDPQWERIEKAYFHVRDALDTFGALVWKGRGGGVADPSLMKAAASFTTLEADFEARKCQRVAQEKLNAILQQHAMQEGRGGEEQDGAHFVSPSIAEAEAVKEASEHAWDDDDDDDDDESDAGNGEEGEDIVTASGDAKKDAVMKSFKHLPTSAASPLREANSAVRCECGASRRRHRGPQLAALHWGHPRAVQQLDDHARGCGGGVRRTALTPELDSAQLVVAAVGRAGLHATSDGLEHVFNQQQPLYSPRPLQLQPRKFADWGSAAKEAEEQRPLFFRGEELWERDGCCGRPDFDAWPLHILTREKGSCFSLQTSKQY